MALARITFNAGTPVEIGKLLATQIGPDLKALGLVIEDMPMAGGHPVIIAPGQELVVRVNQVESLGEIVIDVRQCS